MHQTEGNCGEDESLTNRAQSAVGFFENAGTSGPATIEEATEVYAVADHMFTLRLRLRGGFDSRVRSRLKPGLTRWRLLLGAANRDPSRLRPPDAFVRDEATRRSEFLARACISAIGAPLARLKCSKSLSVLVFPVVRNFHLEEVPALSRQAIHFPRTGELGLPVESGNGSKHRRGAALQPLAFAANQLSNTIRDSVSEPPKVDGGPPASYNGRSPDRALSTGFRCA